MSFVVFRLLNPVNCTPDPDGKSEFWILNPVV